MNPKILVTTQPGTRHQNGNGRTFLEPKGHPVVVVIEFASVTEATAAAKAINAQTDISGYAQKAVVLA